MYLCVCLSLGRTGAIFQGCSRYRTVVRDSRQFRLVRVPTGSAPKLRYDRQQRETFRHEMGDLG